MGLDLYLEAKITEKADRAAFRENPQGYEWAFRLFNSF